MGAREYHCCGEVARRTRKAALDEDFVRELHLRMFDETWGWAGKYRKSDKNIGVHLPTISVEVRNLIDDGRYWLDHDVYSIDKATLRLHHRLVKLHPFVRYERSVHHFVRTVMYHDGRCACSARRADESERRYPEQAERRGARYTSAVIRHRTCELMYY